MESFSCPSISGSTGSSSPRVSTCSRAFRPGFRSRVRPPGRRPRTSTRTRTMVAMADSGRVAVPPARPLLLFDGECGFCRVWIARWKAMTGDRVDYAPSEEAGARFPEIPTEAFRRSVQLVLPDGEVRSGAHAVASTLALAGRGFPLRAYERVPGAARAAEAGYAFIAAHRTAASRATRLLWGSDVTRPEY